MNLSFFLFLVRATTLITTNLSFLLFLNCGQQHAFLRYRKKRTVYTRRAPVTFERLLIARARKCWCDSDACVRWNMKRGVLALGSRIFELWKDRNRKSGIERNIQVAEKQWLVCFGFRNIRTDQTWLYLNVSNWVLYIKLEDSEYVLFDENKFRK